jgi:hypothetical protein
MARKAIIDTSDLPDEEYYDNEKEYSLQYTRYVSQNLFVKVVYCKDEVVQPYLLYTCSLGQLTACDVQEQLCPKIGFDDDGTLDEVLEEGELGCFDIIASDDHGVGFDYVESVRAFENGTGKIIDAMNEIKRIAKVIRDVKQYESKQLNTDSADTIDVFDIPSEPKDGRWVSQDDFLNENINTQSRKFTSRTLQHSRTNGNVTWSTENPAIGRDKDGNILERTGKPPKNYRYRYFLFRENDKTIVTR